MGGIFNKVNPMGGGRAEELLIEEVNDQINVSKGTLTTPEAESIIAGTQSDCADVCLAIDDSEKYALVGVAVVGVILLIGATSSIKILQKRNSDLKRYNGKVQIKKEGKILKYRTGKYTWKKLNASSSQVWSAISGVKGVKKYNGRIRKNLGLKPLEMGKHAKDKDGRGTTKNRDKGKNGGGRAGTGGPRRLPSLEDEDEIKRRTSGGKKSKNKNGKSWKSKKK